MHRPLPAFSLALALAPLAACGAGPDDIVEDWRDAAADHGAMGEDGAFSFAGGVDGGGAFDLAGALVVDAIAAPVTVSGTGVVAAGVVVDGVAGRVIFAGAFHLAAGSVGGAHASGYDGSGVRALDDASALVIDGGVVTEAGGARFQAAGSDVLVDLAPSAEAPLSLSGPLSGSGWHVAADAGFSAHVDDVAVGGASGGDVVIGDDSVAGVTAVFARDVDLVCDGGCDGAGRLTQVVKDGEVLIGADVELAAYDGSFDDVAFSDDIAVTFRPGEVRAVAFAYRERGYAGDAVVTSISAKGDGADLIQVAATPPDGPATTIIGAMQADGTIDVGEALVLVVAGPAIVVVDALIGIVDFFGGGDDGGPQPVPIPSWVQAGEVGTFTVVVSVPAGADDGDRFDARVVVEGANFDKAEVAFQIEVDD
jgi:hypothetical protein